MPNFTGFRARGRWQAGIRASVEYRRLRARINLLLLDVGIPEPWNLDQFVEHVAAHNGRPIRLMAVDVPADGPDAMWVATEYLDAILYDRKLKDLHWEQVISHELSHILLCHRGNSVAGLARGPVNPALLDLVAGNVDVDPVTSAPLFREDSGYSSRQELEAELAASLIWKAAGRRMITPARTLQGADATSVDNLQAIMGRARRV